MRSVLIALVTVGLGASTRADLFLLRTGGQVRGAWLNRDDALRKTYVVRTEFGGEVTLPASQVARIIPQTTTELEYERLRPTVPDTVAGHEKLAAWCLDKGLTQERKGHLTRIIELDSDNQAARTALGYHRVGAHWMTREEEMAAQGKKYYKGRWRTPQEIAILEKETQQTKAEREWFGKLKTWRGWLNKPSRSRQAVQELRAIRSPDAVKAVATYLDDEPVPGVRLLYLEALANINSGSAVSTLISVSLADEEEEVRMTALDYVVRSKKGGVAKRYIEALSSKSNARVNRAAIALRELGSQDAVPSLIDALVTTHTYKIPGTSPGQMSTTFGKGGSGFSAGGTPTRIIRQQKRNPEVLDALIELTGIADYQYDEFAWKAWYAQHIRSNKLDARRD